MLDALTTLLCRLSGAPLAAAVLTIVAAVAAAIVIRALAVLAREVPAILEARRYQHDVERCGAQGSKPAGRRHQLTSTRTAKRRKRDSSRSQLR